MNNRKAVAFTIIILAVALIFNVLLTIMVLSPLFIHNSSPLDKSIVKQFVYDIDPTYPPVVSLDVDLWNSIGIVDSGVTDVNGFVTFTGLVDETYTIKWMWGGVADSESMQIDCTQLVWDFGTNYLASKSGGG